MRQLLQHLACSVLLISVIAMSLRTAFVLHQAHRVPAEALATVPFQNEAGSIAAALAQGKGFCCVFRQPTGPTAWLAPIYPLCLAAIFRLFGAFTVPAFYAAALLNCLFSAFVCVPLFAAGKRIGGLSVGAAGAWLWALFPSGIMLPFEWIWDTSLSALLAAALLAATIALPRSSRKRDAIAYGLLWGLALLTSPALGALLPFFLGWIAYRRRCTRATATPVFLTLSVLLACCLPWTIRNAVQFHRLIPLRSNFAFELWFGNNEVFDEHSRGPTRITRFEQVRRYSQLGESAFLDEKWRQSVQFFRTHPKLALHLMGRRVAATWLGTATPATDFAATDSALVRFLFIWNAVTLAAVLVGIFRLYVARNPYWFPVIAFPAFFPMVYYLTHTSLRLRHPCDPVLALLLALAIFPGRREATAVGVQTTQLAQETT